MDTMQADTEQAEPVTPTKRGRKPKEAGVNLTFEQLKELLATAQQNTQNPADLALQVAQAHQKLQKPENKKHPGISAYSYPEGDVARPRPQVRCDTYWCGTRVRGDVDTAEELELLNRLEPGEYVVSKADGSQMPVNVEVKVNPVTRAFTEMKVVFTPTRDGMLPRTVMMREMIAQHEARQAG